MKKIVLLALVLAVGFVSCDEDDMRNTDVPSVVLNAFNAEFSDAKKVDWEQIGDNFEAEFEIKNVDYEAFLNSEGNLLRHKKEITYADLPESVKTSIESDFKERKIDEVELLNLENEIYYQVEFDDLPMDEKVIFSESGSVNSEIPAW